MALPADMVPDTIRVRAASDEGAVARAVELARWNGFTPEHAVVVSITPIPEP